MPRRPGPSRYQRLVDRWVDLTAWPTAKKTALAMAIAAVSHIAVGLCVIPALTLAPGLVDLPRFVGFYVTWVAAMFVVLGLSLVPAWQGKEGRWTVYLTIVVDGAGVAWVV